MVNIPKLEFWITVLFLQLCKSIQYPYLFSKPQYCVHWDVKRLVNTAKEKEKKSTKLWKHLITGRRRNTCFPLVTSLKADQSSPTDIIQRLVLKHLTQMGCGTPRDFVSYRVETLHLWQLCLRSDPVGPQKAQSREHYQAPSLLRTLLKKLKHDWTVEQMGRSVSHLKWKVPVHLRLNSLAHVLNFMLHFPQSK